MKPNGRKRRAPAPWFALAAGAALAPAIFLPAAPMARAAYRFADFSGRPPIHVLRFAGSAPAGLSPAQIKKFYHLPRTGGRGTIAIIGAYDAPHIERDLAVFDNAFHLLPCTAGNKCFEEHKMSPRLRADAGWSLEASLDVEWAHAIAPRAKILFIEAATQSGPNLLAAIDYAVSRKDVVAVSMSWGGAEFPGEASLDSHFKARPGLAFFAASGDSGAGVQWPAASPLVVAVGGTSFSLVKNGKLLSESAWQGSGGGASAYEAEPGYQRSFGIPRAGGRRAVPDVSYDADPRSGYAVFRSAADPKRGWYVVGGTSAGAPQWAAIHALGQSVFLPKLYADKASRAGRRFFRDIVRGANGTCGYYCDARARYDYVTGLGSPHTDRF